MTQFEQQTHYDVLFHQKRMKDLYQNKINSFDRGLLVQSQSVVANPSLGYRSVDLTNQELVSELDAFEMQELESHAWSLTQYERDVAAKEAIKGAFGK